MKKKYTQKKKAAKKKNTNLKGDDPKIAVLSRQSAQFIEEQIRLADKGSNKSILKLIELYCEAVRADATPHPLLIKYIAKRLASIYYGIGIEPDFSDILEHKELEKIAEKIAGKEKEPVYKTDPRSVFPIARFIPNQKKTAEKHLIWARKVHEYTTKILTEEEVRKYGKNKITAEEAISQVAEEVNRSESTIKEVYGSHLKHLKRQSSKHK